MLRSLYEKIGNSWLSRDEQKPNDLRTKQYKTIAQHLYQKRDSFYPNLFKRIVNVFIRGLNFVLPKSWELNYLDCYVPLTSLELDKLGEKLMPDAWQTSNKGERINLEKMVENAVNKVNKAEVNSSFSQTDTTQNDSKNPNPNIE